MNDEKKWYAVYTCPRSEKKVAQLLSKKKIENYCPLNKIQKQWSDRKKYVFEPLFTSYVFVHIGMHEQIAVRETNGILNFVYWLNKPAVIKKEEIDAIKHFLNDHASVVLEKVEVRLYETVKIITGPFMEFQGQVIAIKSNTIKIKLPTLGYWMHAEVEKSNVKVISDIGMKSNQPA